MDVSIPSISISVLPGRVPALPFDDLSEVDVRVTGGRLFLCRDDCSDPETDDDIPNDHKSDDHKSNPENDPLVPLFDFCSSFSESQSSGDVLSLCPSISSPSEDDVILSTHNIADAPLHKPSETPTAMVIKQLCDHACKPDRVDCGHDISGQSIHQDRTPVTEHAALHRREKKVAGQPCRAHLDEQKSGSAASKAKHSTGDRTWTRHSPLAENVFLKYVRPYVNGGMNGLDTKKAERMMAGMCSDGFEEIYFRQLSTASAPLPRGCSVHSVGRGWGRGEDRRGGQGSRRSSIGSRARRTAMAIGTTLRATGRVFGGVVTECIRG